MGVRFIKIAVLYLVAGAMLGLGMGISGSFTLAPVHAHLALAGWASLALAGFVYLHFPAAAATRLAQAHFWLHNLGLPVFMIGLALMLTGTASVFALTAAGASALLLGFICFAANVLRVIPGAAPALRT